MTPEMLAVRQRLRDDFAFYAANCLKIRNKQGEIVPLVLNAAQRYFLSKIEQQLAETGKVRAVILKGRQQGLSTVIGARLMFRTSQSKGKKALVIAHKADSTRALFDMTRRYYDQLPAIMKPATSYSSRSELVFSGLESSYTVATAGGKGIARGETLQFLHSSEVAFWEPGSAAENLNGLQKCVPNAEGTEEYHESTANGVTGVFAELWRGAVAGTNGFMPIFIPWFWQDEYRLPVPEGFERTDDEAELAGKVEALYGFALDDGQLAWRRIEVGKNGLELFRQEYPSWPDEAFLTTGRPVFNQDQLADLLRSCPDPLRRMTLVPGAASFEEDGKGELRVYEEPSVTGTYYIGADVAMGVRGGDFSVAQVLDAEKRQVATWHGHVHPDYFATILDTLGRWYCDAKIAVESNNHGLLTVVRLSKDLLYPNVYTEIGKDKISDKETVKLGFSTNAKSKPMVIDELRATMREREITVRDRRTLEEMRSFVVTEEGKLEAEQGCHDDTVMALAIANHIHEGHWVPVATDDDDYISGI
jgi:hypothetical protein